MFKNTPPGRYRVVIEAEGYVPRVVDSGEFDGQPGWSFYDCGLSRPAPVAGRVTDEAGRPLQGVSVELNDVRLDGDDAYESPLEYVYRTGEDGGFHAAQVPHGHAVIRLRKSGYREPGLGETITLPTHNIELRMLKLPVRLSVVFGGTVKSEGYAVVIEAEPGAAIGPWSSTRTIDSRSQLTFDNLARARCPSAEFHIIASWETSRSAARSSDDPA